MPRFSDETHGTPDALNPEWDAYAQSWAVDVTDFGDPLDAARFLARRKRIFAETRAQGFPKEMLAAFQPDKPGFEERVGAAFSRLASVAGKAAE